jgi:hypothetical protein
VNTYGLNTKVHTSGLNSKVHISWSQSWHAHLLLTMLCVAQVYDRLQPVGVCLSYQKSIDVLDALGKVTANCKLVNTINDKKLIRFVGDNVNYTVKITNQHQSDEGKTKVMHHAFASAILINDFNFTGLSIIKPQQDFRQMTVQDLLLNKADYTSMQQSNIIMIAHVAAKFFPSLDFVLDVIPSELPAKHRNQLTKKTQVIPLETLQKNEMYYDDVVDILDNYEKVLSSAFQEAGLALDEDTLIQIGGDQLTRERFSGAKRLRGGTADDAGRFRHLSPITFEMFHLLMNFLECFMKFLYNADSSQQMGTMKAEIDRIMRTTFEEDVKKGYDADKDFVISFVDAYIVEMVRNFFGMTDIHGPFGKHVPPDFNTHDEKKTWVYDTFGKLVDDLNSRKHYTDSDSSNVVVDGQIGITVQLADGTVISVPVINSHKPKKEPIDYVKNYAHLVIELGLVYKELVELCHIPDRDRMIRLLKQCMVIFKAKSNNSKYAVECHRFLVQQLCVLSEKEAHETAYSMFVNTKGSHCSHIPADLQMEYLVKLIKKHIKHMFSNKTAANITKRTRSLACIQAISQNYDEDTEVKKRAKKHKKSSHFDDELVMVDDLRQCNPFQSQPGRCHRSFPRISSTILDYLDINHFHAWIQFRTAVHATELG